MAKARKTQKYERVGCIITDEGPDFVLTPSTGDDNILMDLRTALKAIRKEELTIIGLDSIRIYNAPPDPKDLPSLNGLCLENALVQYSSLDRFSFDDINANEAEFKSSDLTSASFKEASLHYSNFTNCVLVGASFRGAYLDDAHFTACVLEGAKFDGADLTGVSFEGVLVDGTTSFRGASLEAHAGKGVGSFKIGDHKRPFLHIGPVGSEHSYLTVFMTTDGPVFRRGCFSGDMDAWLDAVKAEHGKSAIGKEYRRIAKLAHKHYKAWK